jgi:chemotaxis protein methyltransferase CheR
MHAVEQRAPATRADGLNMEVSVAEFRSVASLVQKTFGIHLPETKRAMMSCRMYKVVRAAGCGSFAEFYRKHLTNPTHEALSNLANALSTNHTYFNREDSHFWFFRDEVLPELIRHQQRVGRRDIRVWCAASSSGEEPYTLAMVIRDALGSSAGNFQGGLLATDISKNALGKARKGIYPSDGAMELPESYYRKFFRSVGDGMSEVVPEIKSEVTFRRFNLMNQRYPFKQPFHAVFCRNVMIYFEEDTKKKVVERIYDVTAPGGYLFVGMAETISGLGTGFRAVCPGVYRKV